VAVAAGRVSAVRTVYPGGIVGPHDVTVYTGSRVAGEIAIGP